MASVPAQDPIANPSTNPSSAETPAEAEPTSKASSNASTSPLTTAYSAAIAAYKTQLDLMVPTRLKYDELFTRHNQIQAKTDLLIAKLTAQHSTYQRHKQYFISLSNNLLASNIALRGAALPFSDDQILTHASLYHDFRCASKTLMEMIIKNKRLENEKDRSFTMDQQFYARCREMFKVVDEDCSELDRLHAKVLEVGAKMGKKPDCGSVGKGCISCIRNAERESRRIPKEKKKVGKGGGGGSGKGKGKGGMGKAAEGKQRLEDILEEVELKNAAG